MATLPVRNLGQLGVIPDKSPYALPLNAFSASANVLFDEGRAQRAPVFKRLYEQMRQIQPYSGETHTYDSIGAGTYENTQGPVAVQQRFIGSYDTTTIESVIVCDMDGTVREYPNGVLKNVTPIMGTGQTLVTSTSQWTHAQVAGVSMLARKGMVPYVRNLQAQPIYKYAGSNWPSTYSASLVRPFGDFFMTMFINKNGTDYPTMIKWCHPMQFGMDPDTIRWDPSDTTSLAGENILGEMRTPIRDGLTLGNAFMIYSDDQVWTVELTESSKVFNFRKVFQNGGVIGANCLAEVDGIHYVFGADDLYKHDGVTRKSIADERVRKWVYSDMNRDSKDSFFVHHDTNLNLIYFCYVSRDLTIGFPGTTYCNRAAVYNYRADTWGFMDLPNVVGASETNLSLYQAGYGINSTSATPKVSVMLGVYDKQNGLTESRVYALDNPDVGFVYLPAHAETLKPAVLERIGIDLDKEANFELRSYKQIKSILPQITFEDQGQVQFQVGASDQINGPINWQDPISFDHINDYKVDTRSAGRYLAIRVISPTSGFFRFPGFDVEVQKIARR